MDARVIMNKKAEGYEWLVIDLHTMKVLETFPAGSVDGAHEAMDRYNAEAEDKARTPEEREYARIREGYPEITA